MVRCFLSWCFSFATAIASVQSSNQLHAQGSFETVNAPGRFKKLLTPTLTDRWSFQGKANQTIIANVTTNDFDAVVELIRADGEKEQVLIELDDPGSNCAMRFRLPADGEYKLRVHGFENKGGGNYQVELQQFQATPILINERVLGALDPKGKAHFYFTVEDDSFASLQLQGESISSQFKDDKGVHLQGWQSLLDFDKGGEKLLELSGAPGVRFEFVLGTVPRHELTEDKKLSQKLVAKSPCVFEIEAKKGTFRVIEIESTRPIASHLVYSPRKREEANRIELEEAVQPFHGLPIGSKGLIARYAIMFGRSERFQLQLSSNAATMVNVVFKDVVTQLNSDQIVQDQLVVGSTRFYQLKREQGKTLVVKAESNQFDTRLVLLDSTGEPIETDDDGADGLNSQITHSSYKPDLSLLAVSSVGNGGGGAFQLSLRTEEAKAIEIGPTYSRQSIGGDDQWLVQGAEGQLIVFVVRGTSSEPHVRILGSNGLELTSAGPMDNMFNTVFAFEFPKTEKYNVLVSTSEGEYKMQLFEPGK